MYPQYPFQHSVLIIGNATKSESMVRGGLLTYPAHFEFCAANYELALGKIRSTRPDLLVVSVEFEKGSVLDFAKKATESYKLLPSIYLTEPHLNDLQESILKVGAFDFIQHPSAEPAELIRRMDRAVKVTRKYRGKGDTFSDLHEESRNKRRAIAELLEEKNEFPLA